MQALVHRAPTLTLRLRKDPLTRPLFGTKAATSELLVKVVKRVSRKTGRVLDTQVTPVGIIDATWTFDALADFQVTDVRPLNKRPRIGMMEDTPSFLGRMDREEPLLMAPPQFATLDHPFDYGFKPGKAQPDKPKRSVQGRQGARISRANGSKTTTHVMGLWKDAPPSEAPKMPALDGKVARVWETRVRRMFVEVRPVWTMERLMVALWREKPDGDLPTVRVLKVVCARARARWARIAEVARRRKCCRTWPATTSQGPSARRGCCMAST